MPPKNPSNSDTLAEDLRISDCLTLEENDFFNSLSLNTFNTVFNVW